MAELLHAESLGRFARQAALRVRAEAAMASLVDGFLAWFGGELPTEVRKAFPGFAAAIRNAWRPIKERRGLLLWLSSAVEESGRSRRHSSGLLTRRLPG